MLQILDRDSRKCSHSVKLYMLELYQDELMDLLKPRGDKSKGAMSNPEVSSGLRGGGGKHRSCTLKLLDSEIA